MWAKSLGERIQDVRGKLQVHKTRRYNTGIRNKTDYITVHHSGTEQGNAFSFASYHVNNHGWPGIGYHFVILKSGQIQWCHDQHIISYHTVGRNRANIGICLVGAGDFTYEQTDSLKQLVSALCSTYSVSPEKVLGHREFDGQSTVCPNLDMNKFRREILLENGYEITRPSNRKLLKRGERGSEVKDLQNRLIKSGVQLPRFGADGIFGGETENAVKQFQAENGLKRDGIAGPLTWGMLLKHT